MREDVHVAHGRWACVTAGEYDRRSRRVVINEAVVEATARATGHAAGLVRAAIVAHEMAHAAGLGATRVDDERRSREAAVAAAGASVVDAIDRVLRKQRDAHRSGR